MIGLGKRKFKRNLKILLVLFMCLFVSTSSLAWGGAKEKSATNLSKPKSSCPEIKKDKERLKCYDEAFKGLKEGLEELGNLFKSPSTNTNISGKRKEGNSLKKKSDELKRVYIENITLYDIEADYHETYLDKNVPGVTFKLKNEGSRTLKEVEVTVYFKDKSGVIIFEEDFYPILAGGLIRRGKPLKPGYIWQQERNRFYKVESVPDEWEAGSVEAKITNIEFAEVEQEKANGKPLKPEMK